MDHYRRSRVVYIDNFLKLLASTRFLLWCRIFAARPVDLARVTRILSHQKNCNVWAHVGAFLAGNQLQKRFLRPSRKYLNPPAKIAVAKYFYRFSASTFQQFTADKFSLVSQRLMLGDRKSTRLNSS